MAKAILLLKNIGVEIFIVFLYILLINNYLGNAEKTMNADGVGYYDYLPSLFIHHDMLRNNAKAEKDTVLYERISSYAFYVDYQGFKVNKYPCGTAVLEAPFFFYTYLTTQKNGNQADGYQTSFQITIFHAALFYLFLTLFFLALLLKLYHIRKPIIIITQLLLVFSTGILEYANYDAGFSHIYSMFAITAFAYLAKSFFVTRQRKYFFLAALFLGLIVILRQLNVVIILFIPFLAGSFSELKVGLSIFKDIKSVFLSILIFLGMVSIQGILWYAQTGHFLVYSYQGEGFDFLKPEIFNILFSYRKGLFVYTPILLVSLLGLIYMLYKKQYYLTFTWMLFFSVLTYLLSSWHSWYYGCSFGQRPYIDYYVIFFISLAILLNGINLYAKFFGLLIAFATVPINIMQAYQYKAFIMEWINMDEKKYWDIFLKTDDKYKGLVWKKSYYMDYLEELSRYKLGDFEVKSGDNFLLFEVVTDTLIEVKKLEIIQVKFNNEFFENNDSRVILSVTNNDEKTSYYWHAVPLIHFKELDFGEYQTGFYNFQFTPIQDTMSRTIKISISGDNQLNSIKDVEVLLLRKK